MKSGPCFVSQVLPRHNNIFRKKPCQTRGGKTEPCLSCEISPFFSLVGSWSVEVVNREEDTAVQTKYRKPDCLDTGYLLERVFCFQPLQSQKAVVFTRLHRVFSLFALLIFHVVALFRAIFSDSTIRQCQITSRNCGRQGLHRVYFFVQLSTSPLSSLYVGDGFLRALSVAVMFANSTRRAGSSTPFMSL